MLPSLIDLISAKLQSALGLPVKHERAVIGGTLFQVTGSDSRALVGPVNPVRDDGRLGVRFIPLADPAIANTFDDIGSMVEWLAARWREELPEIKPYTLPAAYLQAVLRRVWSDEIDVVPASMGIQVVGGVGDDVYVRAVEDEGGMHWRVDFDSHENDPVDSMFAVACELTAEWMRRRIVAATAAIDDTHDLPF